MRLYQRQCLVFITLLCVLFKFEVNAASSVLLLDLVQFENPDLIFDSNTFNSNVGTKTSASDSIVLVGDRGLVYRCIASSNLKQCQNLSKSQVVSPTSFMLTAVTHNQANASSLKQSTISKQLFAVGHNSSIIKSQDNGLTWQVNFKAGKQSPFLDIIFMTPNNAISIGAYGLFYSSSDGGETWQTEAKIGLLHKDDQDYLAQLRLSEPQYFQQELIALQPHLNQIIQHQDKLYLTGESGLLAVSHNNGQTWTRIDEFYSGSLFDLVAMDNTLVAAGMRGHAFAFDINQSEPYLTLRQSIQLPETININKVIPIRNRSLLGRYKIEGKIEEGTHEYTESNSFLLLGNTRNIWLWLDSQQPKIRLLAKSDKHNQIASAKLIDEDLLLVGDAGLEVLSFKKLIDGFLQTGGFLQANKVTKLETSGKLK